MTVSLPEERGGEYGVEMRISPLDYEAELDTETVEDMLQKLSSDCREVFDTCEKYYKGEHSLPVTPDGRGDEVLKIKQRAVQNWIPLLVNVPAQLCYWDGYRRSVESDATDGTETERKDKDQDRRFPPEFKHWQRFMRAKQQVVYRASLKYGASYVVYDRLDPAGPRPLVLPTRKTIAYFNDPVNDIRPAYIVTERVKPTDDDKGYQGGLLVAWDHYWRYEMEYRDGGLTITKQDAHDHESGCPAVRYTCYMDDEGKVMGVVFPSLKAQDRVNQASFLTDTTASFTSFKVRWAAGLEPEVLVDKDTGEPILDSNGFPVVKPIKVSQTALLTVDDPQAKFGELGATDLKPFTDNERKAQESLLSLNQMPGQLITGGDMANLSAEAIEAAKNQLKDFTAALKSSWEESHMELMRIIAEAIGEPMGAESYDGECRWRDLSAKSFAQMADGLGKLVAQTGLPQRAAWAMVPGVTPTMLEDWQVMKDDEIQTQGFELTQGVEVAAQRERSVPVRSNATGGVNAGAGATSASGAPQGRTGPPGADSGGAGA